MRGLVENRAVRAVVLLLAMGVGGIAGAPAIEPPPRTVVTASGGEDDRGGGGDGGGPDGPTPPTDGPREQDRGADPALSLVGVG